MKILIIGNGYVGKRCADAWPEAILSDKIINTVDDVLELIVKYQPEVILNAAGIVGKPNVDWCEIHQWETIKGNTILPLIIAEACQQKNVYLLHIGTGCIFYGNHPAGRPWQENDFANPTAVYTRCKYAADLALSTLDNVGIARIRMPIDHISHPANLVDKLISFAKVVDVENSITVLDDMVEVFAQLLAKKATGIFHVTNPGSVKHQEILAWYQKYIDQNHHNEWMSESDLVVQGLADKKRSNNIMSSENLAKFDITMRPAKEAVEDTIKKYQVKKLES